MTKYGILKFSFSNIHRDLVFVSYTKLIVFEIGIN